MIRHLVALSLATLTTSAVALSNPDAAFQGAYALLDSWVTGSLGKLLALIVLGFGLAVGVGKLSAKSPEIWRLAMVLSVFTALALLLGPGVIESVFSATL